MPERKYKKIEEFEVKKKTNGGGAISDEELAKLLKGCHRCHLKASYTIEEDSSIPHNVTRKARVVCGGNPQTTHTGKDGKPVQPLIKPREVDQCRFRHPAGKLTNLFSSTQSAQAAD